jgi:catechol 2,3-dioxygenase-like lactoylglutathione lyase family enzyme
VLVVIAILGFHEQHVCDPGHHRTLLSSFFERDRLSVQGFNHYNLRAPRPLLDELRDFYCEIVGLYEGERPAFRSFGYWLYAGGRDVLHLSECSPDERRACHVATTFDHVAFTCTDYPATRAHLQDAGVEFGEREVAATGIRQIFFKDPAGNGIEFNFAADGH